MSYRVRTDSFEGPFDILLYLVSRQRVDIGTISIAEIADQYLAEIARMQVVDLDVASDFLLVAATLLELKAASLVPRDKDELEEDIAELAPSEARDLLVERLLAYKQYKNVSAMLEAREREQMRLHERPFGPDPEFLKVMPDFLADVPLESIAFLAAGAFARRETALLDSEHIAAKREPVEVHVRALHARIRNKKRLRFSEIAGPGTPAPIVVVSFLAALELYKRGMVDLVQSDAFGEIELTYIEGSGELVLEDDEESHDGFEPLATNGEAAAGEVALAEGEAGSASQLGEGEASAMAALAEGEAGSALDMKDEE